MSAIWHRADALAGEIESWLEAFGDAPDPGADDIVDADLAVHALVKKWGSPIRRIRDELRGLVWALRSFTEPNREEPPDPADYDAAGYFLMPDRNRPCPPRPSG